METIGLSSHKQRYGCGTGSFRLCVVTSIFWLHFHMNGPRFKLNIRIGAIIASISPPSPPTTSLSSNKQLHHERQPFFYGTISGGRRITVTIAVVAILVVLRR
eukprot:scaffold60973_cov26-Attheya_sp.AAC.1